MLAPIKVKSMTVLILIGAVMSGVAFFLSIPRGVSHDGYPVHLTIFFASLLLAFFTLKLVSSRKKEMLVMVLLGWLGYVWAAYPFMTDEERAVYHFSGLFGSAIGFIWVLYLYFDKGVRDWLEK